jgi:peptidoglycan/xylan/chitin deacetylase (PgdA/CDA1 family)
VARLAVKRALASPAGWRWAAPVRKVGCFVLTYHRIGVPGDPYPHIRLDLFRRQMEWISAHCEPIAPAAIKDATQRSTRRRPPVAVTFDDAYTDLFEHAYPVLKRLGIPAACFVPTDYVDRRLPFWWDVLHTAVGLTARPDVRLPWNESAAFTMDPAGRARLLETCKRHLKQLPDEEKDPTVIRLVERLGLDAGSLPVAPSTMTWSDIRSAMDVITFGGHTHTHAIMPVLSAERLQWEVDQCRARLEQETGVRPLLFAYPSGAFSEPVKAAVRRGGFETGFSTLEGVNGHDTDWLEVRRVHGPRSIEDLAWLLSGISLEMATPRGAASA